MVTNTDLKRPDWLTDEVIAELRNDLAASPKPYTHEEVCNLGFDGTMDTARYDAYKAKTILEKFGLI